MSDQSTIKNKTSQFGACSIGKMSPPPERVGVKAVNLVVPFEEALKLNLAIDECIRKLNRYNRSTAEGKKAALTLVVHFDKDRIRVLEGRLS